MENGRDVSRMLFVLEQKGDFKVSDYLNKLDEEVREFKESLFNKDRENQFEELLDVIQIMITIKNEVLKPLEGEMMKATVRHNKKLLIDRQYGTKGVALTFTDTK